MTREAVCSWLEKNGMWFGKLVVLVYYIALIAVSSYALCTLWLAAPPAAPGKSNSGPPACTGTLGGPPQITALEPDTVAVGQNYASIAVIGCNFTNGAKVRFNGLERTTNA